MTLRGTLADYFNQTMPDYEPNEANKSESIEQEYESFHPNQGELLTHLIDKHAKRGATLYMSRMDALRFRLLTLA